MVDPLIQKEIFEHLSKLPAGQQRRVLDLARALATGEPVGVPGSEFLRFAGLIDPEDLKQMAKVIEEECERVDLNEW